MTPRPCDLWPPVETEKDRERENTVEVLLSGVFVWASGLRPHLGGMAEAV